MGKADGNALQASFNGPIGICSNPLDGCLYVSEHIGNSIRKLSIRGKSPNSPNFENFILFLEGTVTTFIATGLNLPWGFVMNHNENTFYAANYGNNTISAISAQGTLSHCCFICAP
jgi:hypothetical protein